jgi:hypothetical protein
MLQGESNVPTEPFDTGVGTDQPDFAGLQRQFLDDVSGRPGARLLVQIEGTRTLQLSLDRPCVIIGSHADCDLQIHRPSILPQHAYVQWIDGHVYCCSLGDDPVGAWLGDVPLTMGALRLSIVGHEPALTELPQPQARSSRLAAEMPQLHLRFAGVEQHDNQWPVGRVLTLIGRGEQCKLRLDHPDIPLVLACLVRTATSCWLVNLSGADAVSVNDRFARQQLLDVGDRLMLGPFAVELSSSPPAAKPREARVTSAVRELAARHRRRLGALNKSLDAVQLHLDSAHLDAVPELKSAVQQYVLYAQRHHREVQDALERLSGD